MDLGLSAVASVPLNIVKGAQRAWLDVKYTTQGRVWFILRTELSSTDLEIQEKYGPMTENPQIFLFVGCVGWAMKKSTAVALDSTRHARTPGYGIL